MRLSTDLNQAQRRAVEAGDGPVVIVAGPGTGKTKTLTARIVHLLSQNIPAQTILALTFTNKAAKEMQSRVRQLLKAPPYSLQGTTLQDFSGTWGVRVMTFHALCHELLSQHRAEPIEFINESERLQLIKTIPKPATLKNYSTRELGLLISRAKNSLQPDEGVAKLVKHYNLALAEKELHDFDDLLLKAHELCQKDFVSPWRHVLVDEFQDTNLLQYELLKLFAPSGNIIVIGDPLQSIYGFRGASGGIFDRFKSDFPAHAAVTLTKNYRSAPEIVRVTNAIFNEAEPLEAHIKTAGCARAVQVLNEYGEAAWVIGQIEKALGGTDFLRSHNTDQTQANGQHFADFAILYRSRRAAQTVQKMLDESGIPYQVVGEGSPYEQPAVKQIIQTLRVIHNPTSNLPSGSYPLGREGLLGVGEGGGMPVSRIAGRIVEKLGLEGGREVRQFLGNLLRFDDQPLAAYLKYIDEIAEQDFYDPRADAVTLSTIHAAKGLEFEHVFVIAAEENILPHKNADPAEEKRLFYVAATRAKSKLDILHAKNRGGEPAKTSRFVAELPTEVLEQFIDPQIPAQLQRLKKRAQKRSQQSLF